MQVAVIMMMLNLVGAAPDDDVREVERTFFGETTGTLPALDGETIAEQGPRQLGTCYYRSPSLGWVVCMMPFEELAGTRFEVAFLDARVGVWIVLPVALERQPDRERLARVNELMARASDWEPMGPPHLRVDFNFVQTFADTPLGPGRTARLEGRDLVIREGDAARGRVEVISETPLAGPNHVVLWAHADVPYAVVVLTDYSDGYLARIAAPALLALGSKGAFRREPATVRHCASAGVTRFDLLRRACAGLSAEAARAHVRIGGPALARR